MQERKLILGQPGPSTDTYVHDQDVQQLVIEIWAVANMTGNWREAGYAMATLVDLIKTASAGLSNPLTDDLTFLLDLCWARGGRKVWPRLKEETARQKGKIRAPSWDPHVPMVEVLG